MIKDRYSKGKKCYECDKPIANANTSGKCKKCYTKSTKWNTK